MKRIWLIFFILWSASVHSQNYSMPGGTVTTCSGNFYDTGGNGGNYASNENVTTTFCPSTAGQCVSVSFSSFNVESGFDFLYIYNGPNTGSPQVMGSPFTGTTSPGAILSTAAGGCLTFRFTSDFSVAQSGWSATISCSTCGAPPPCSGTTPACANPNPDVCTSACNLGTLSTPPACPSTTTVTNTYCLNNSTATAENPYSALVGCVPSGNMPSPAADVWYRFTATSTNIDLNITGAVGSPSIGLYEGTNCSNLIGRSCANGSANILTTTLTPLTPGSTYYLQISGGNATDRGNFTLTLTSYNDCNNCIQGATLTATPAPANGQYSPGQTINFCLNVTNWNASAVNWIHGIGITFGSAWNISTLTSTPPASCDGQGTWAWYSSVMGSNTGGTYGPGFFYDSPSGNLGGPYPDGNPGDNYGDNCSGPVSWNFCWSVQAGLCPPNVDGASMNISVNTYGDAESGSWTSMGCEQDPIYSFSGQLNCCAPPTATVNQNVSCFGGSNGQATAVGSGTSPFTYQWSTSPVKTTSVATGLTAGTYTVTVTDADGCVATASVTITQPALLTVAITPANVSCNGLCNGTLSAAASGGTTAYTYSWSGALGTGPNKTGVCANSYTVTVTDSKGCTAIATAAVTQPAVLTVTMTPVNETCSGACNGSATATVSGGTAAYTYAWSGGGTGSVKNSLCSGSYSVSITDAMGCTTIGTFTINPGSPLTSGFTYNGNQCLTGNSFNFTNTGTMGVTYSWTFPSGTPATSTAENPSGVTWSAAGTYTITQTVSSGSCMNTSTLNITVFPQPAVSISKTDVTCNGLCNGALTATGSGGTPVYTYSWSGGLGTGGNKTGVCAGSYTVTITDANGCTATATAVITQPTALSATVAGTNVTCNGLCNGMGTVTVSGGVSPYSYQWGATANNQTTSIATGLCAGTHSVTVTDNKSCTAAASVVITQPAVLTVTMTPVNETCSGACDGSAAATVSGGTTAYTYSWSGGGTGSAKSPLCAGTYTVTITDAKGCTVIGSATINAGSPLASGFTYNGNQCLSGNSFNFTNTGAMGVTYSWTFPSGTPATSTTENPTGVIWSAAGTYTITQVVTSGSCMNTSTLSITVFPQPAVSISKTDVTCNGLCNGSLNATGSGGTPAFTYSWSGGLGTGGNKTGVCAGSYTVTITDANGCTGTSTAVITQPNALTASIAGTDVTCNGLCNGMGTVTVSGGTTPYAYQWGATANNQTTSVATALCAGTHSMTVTDNKSCTATASVVITQPAAMVLTPTSTNSTCGASTGSVSVSVSGGAPAYTYVWGGACSNSSCTNLGAGTYPVTVTDAGGCTKTASATVNDAGGVSAAITIDQNITCNGLCNGQATASVIGGGTPYTYIWSTGQTVTSTATSNVRSGLCGGNISVTVTDGSGCASSGAGVIVEPSALSAIPTIVNETCNLNCNGSITITSSGGVNPYTYSWPAGPVGPVPSQSGLCAGTKIITVTDVNGCTVTVNAVVMGGATVTASTVPTNATCNNICDGSANLTVSGGTTPYTFLWSNGSNVEDPTGLCDGNYSVTITDAAGCSTTASVTITEPPAVTVTAVTTPATCGLTNGTATATGSGGTGSFSYVWNTIPSQSTQTATGLAGAAYSVTATDASGCTGTANATVSSSAGGSVTVGIDQNVSCTGLCDGQATATVAGGGTPYTYVWSISQTITTTATSNSQSNLCGGTINVTVTDGSGCAANGTGVITAPGALTAFPTIVNETCNLICNGSITITPSGGATPYTYAWPGGPVGTTSSKNSLCPGTYDITVTDVNSCTVIVNAVVMGGATVTASAVPAAATCNNVCDGSANLTVSGGTVPYTFLWSNGSNVEDPTGLCDGNYSVTVTDAAGCSTTASVTITEPAAVTVTTTTTPATCGQINGTATATGSGGTGSFSYVWNTIPPQSAQTAIGLAGAAYSVTATDANGCTGTANATVTSSAGGSVTAGVGQNVSCNGLCNGITISSMSGGAAPYTYIWNNPVPAQSASSATGLCPGTYTVTITDANNCSGTASAVITEPAALNLSVSFSTNIACFNGCNGTIVVSASGGVGSNVYQWNPSVSLGTSATGLCAGTYSITVTDANNCTATTSRTLTQPPQLTQSIAATTASCNAVCDASASVTAGGGVAPYSYVWSNSQTGSVATGLCSGAAPGVTVTDANGCTVMGSTTISSNPDISLSFSSTDATCGLSNGTVTVAITNGTSPYIITWNTGCSTTTCTGLGSGGYPVTVTDSKGCSATGTGSVSNAAGPTILLDTVTNINCYGSCNGSASVIVTDGFPPYTYTWNTTPPQTNATATGLCALTYTVTVTDNLGCISTLSPSVTQPAQLVIAITNIVNANCYNQCDGSMSVTVSGGTLPYTYVWSSGSTASTATGLCAGNYVVTVMDANSCSAISNSSITQPPLLFVVLQSDSTSCFGVCNGGSTATAGGGSPPYSYLWNDAGSQTGPVANTLCAQSYSVTVTDSNGCTVIGTTTVNAPVTLIASITSYGNVDCFGNNNGYAQAGISGGTTPYTYQWSDSQSGIIAINLGGGMIICTITDVNGCKDTAQVIIQEPAQLGAVTTGNNVSCYGLCDGSASLTVNGGTSPYTYLWDANAAFQTTSNATALCANSYTVTVTDNTGCSKTGSVVITQPQQLSFTYTTNSSTCGYANGSACATVVGGQSPFSILWNDPLSTAGNCIDSVIAGVYNPVLGDGNGCFYTAPVIINDIAGATIDTIISTEVSCFGDSNGTATAVVSGGTPQYIYTWQNGAITIAMGSLTVFSISGGTYTFTIEDANSCITSKAVTIFEPSLLVSAIISLNNAGCNGSCDGDITLGAGGGSPPYTYAWSTSPQQTATVATGLCAGNYNVIITDANGCTSVQSGTIAEPAAINLAPDVDSVNCNGGSDGMISLSPSGGQGPYSINWLPPGTGSGTVVTNLPAATYTAMLQDANNCTVIEDITVDEPALLAVITTKIDARCGNSNGSMAALAGGGVPPYTYLWVPGAYTTPIVSAIPSNVYVVTVWDFHGCSESDTVIVNNVPGPDINLVTSQNVLCYGDLKGQAVVTFLYSSQTPFTYTWSTGSPNNDTAFALAAGQVSVTVTDGNNCTDVDTTVIVQPSALAVSPSSDQTICYGQSTQIYVTASGGVPPFTYIWDNSLPSTSSQTVSPLTTTTYQVTVTDANSCAKSEDIQIIVNPPLVVPDGAFSICLRDNITLTAAATEGNGGPYTYAWNNGFSGNQITIVQPLIDDTVRVIASDGCSRNDTAFFYIDVNPLPVSDFGSSEDYGCKPFATYFYDYSSVSAGNIVSWDWNFGDGGSSSLRNPVHTYTAPGVYDVALIVTTDNGCKDTLTRYKYITVSPAPDAYFTEQPEITTLINALIVFTDGSSITSGSIVSWSWNFGDILSDSMNTSMLQNPDHLYSDTGTYIITLTVTSDKNCVSVYIDSVRINSEYILFAPSAFTPGDENGINDYFIPKIIGLKESRFEMYIFDRWGDLIYETRDINKPWDGKANKGKKLVQQDVYIWLIRTVDLNSDKHEYVGHVTLVK